jgi:dTDP-4-dehydrorhamnose 3,5-epimerase
VSARFEPAPVAGVVVVRPTVHRDERGFFLETFRRDAYARAGVATEFAQENQSRSRRGVLRGLHYQITHTQGKLVRVARGRVWDAVVDLRRSSPTFGRAFGLVLDDEEGLELWVPPGCAHGYLTLSTEADFLYACTDVWDPQGERTIRWDDPDLALPWPLAESGPPALSEKDARGLSFRAAPLFP